MILRSGALALAVGAVVVSGCDCGGASRRAHPNISVEPASIDFGTVPPGDAGVAMLRVRDDGVVTLEVSALRLTKDTRSAFSLSHTELTVPSGGSATVEVRYQPPAEGTDTATLIIESNADNASELLVSLLGSSRCAPETDAALCARLGKNCGAVTSADNCGSTRSVSCGACTMPEVCGSSNVCGCSAEGDAAFCARLGKNCGSVTAADNCGAMRSVTSCGTCTLPETCQATNVCICVAETDPAFCARQGKTCGSVTADDNCGAQRTATCGTCTLPQTCQPTNLCACVPEGDLSFCARLGKNCGAVTAADNCGAQRMVASCGSCTLPETCQPTNVCACQESDSAFCARHSAVCGALTSTDNCGLMRTVASCGTCTMPLTCNGSNQCVCPFESDASFCARHGKNCGSLTAPDLCGAPRNVASCGTCNGIEQCGGGGAIGPFQSTTALPSGRYFHALAAHNGRLYVTGGQLITGAVLAQVLTAPIGPDGNLGAWTATTPLAAGRYDHASVAHNGFLYVIGGTPVSSVVFGAIDALGNVPAWTTTTALPAPRHGHGAVVNNGFLYVLGGNAGGETRDVLFAPINVDGTLGAWTATSSLVGTRGQVAAAAANGFMYVVGGVSTGFSVGGVEVAPINANGTLGMWNTSGSVPNSIAYAAAFSANGALYVTGGYEGDTSVATGISHDEVWTTSLDATGFTNGWVVTSRFTGRRYDHAAVFAGNRLYVVGGWRYGSGMAFSDVQFAGVGNGPVENVCGCNAAVGDSNTDFCLRLGKKCGEPTSGIDACGAPRNVSYCLADGWTPNVSSIPNGRNAAGAAIGSVIYAVSGYNGGGHSTANEAFDVDGGTWSSGAGILQSSSPAAASLYGKLYLAGGTDNVNHIASLNEYDPATNMWSARASMPGGARSQLCGAALGGAFYALGGYGGSCITECTRLEAYTPGSGWATRAPLTQSRSGLACAVLNGRLWAVGGRRSFPMPADVIDFTSYDPASNTWATHAPLPAARSSQGFAAANGRLYAFGGAGPGYPNGSDEVSIYDPVSNTWTAGAPMPRLRSGAISVTIGNQIYVLGGMTGNSAVMPVDAYCPAP